jgi:hypothetical protein
MYPEKLNIEPTKRSPWIVFEPGRIFVMGRAIIDNPSIFFETAIKWVSAFSKEWAGKTKIDLGFEYINTGSTKWLYLLLRELAEMNNMPVNAEITWYYENGDDDMCELGYILRSLVDCKFAIVEVEEMNDSVYQDFLNKRQNN